MTEKNKPVNYLANKNLIRMIRECKENDGICSNELASAFMLLADRYIRSPKFAGYTQLYKEQMKSDAIFTLLLNWSKFDDEKYDNPFAYFTQITHNSFLQVLNKEARNRDTRDALKAEQGSLVSHSYHERYGSHHDEDMDISEVYDIAHEKYVEDAEIITEEPETSEDDLVSGQA